MKKLIRFLFYIWAKSLIAPGIIHSLVDKYAHLLNEKNLSQTLLGANKVQCNLKDHVQSRIYFFKAYEPIEAYLLLMLIKEDSVFIDAGANVGFYSLVTSTKLSSNGHVFAFEPVPSNRKQLNQNIKLSDNKKITVVERGLWFEKDTLSFSLDETHKNNHGSFTAASNLQTTLQVPAHVDTLDHLANQLGIKKIDYIKMDIEGSELFALQGAMNIIRKFKPTILIEINQDACHKMGYSSQEIDKLLLPLEYKIFQVNSLSQNSRFIDSTSEITQGNVFFLNTEDQKRILQEWDYKAVKRYFFET